jgi:hypothetical protein
VRLTPIPVIEAAFLERLWMACRSRAARRRVRWLLVHEAGCIECRKAHDDNIRRELVREGLIAGARIPRSLRHLVVECKERAR